MFEKLIGFFERNKQKREQHAQEVARKRWEELEKKHSHRQKDATEEAVRKLAEVEKKRKEEIEKQFSSVNYQEFETVMEMVYIRQKAYYAQKRKAWTKEQKEDFDKKFRANLTRCQKKSEFCKDYADYAEASVRGFISKPRTSKDVKLNKITKEIEDIDLACQPLVMDKEICERQRKTRFKYEKALYGNKRRRENLVIHEGKAIEI